MSDRAKRVELKTRLQSFKRAVEHFFPRAGRRRNVAGDSGESFPPRAQRVDRCRVSPSGVPVAHRSLSHVTTRRFLPVLYVSLPAAVARIGQYTSRDGRGSSSSSTKNRNETAAGAGDDDSAPNCVRVFCLKVSLIKRTRRVYCRITHY